jgi:hypothetical protein
MITAFLILKLYMEAVFNSHLHFDWFVHGWLNPRDLNKDFVFLRDWWEPLALNFDTYEVFHRDIATVV